MQPFDVPPLVRQRAESRGTVGRNWLRTLPDKVTTLSADWGLEIDDVLSGGTASLVVGATDAGGRACVVKLAMVLDEEDAAAFDRSVVVHGLAEGRGCARLIDHHNEATALLLERLGPNLHVLDMPLPLVLETIAATLQTFWRPVADDVDLPDGADKAQWLARFIVTTWEELGGPCSRAVVDRARAYCDERAAAFDPATAVLVHADAHGWNTLQASDGSFKFVDPEGLRSTRAHDLSVPMREYNEPLLAGDTARLVHERAELLASACDADPAEVWQWGFIERVSTGLAGLRDFDDDQGLAFLEVAARCAAADV